MKKSVYIARMAVIATIYFVLSLIFFPISYGPIQFRLSEILTLLPIIFPEAIPGLFIGCIITNAISPTALFDVSIGSLATLVAAVLTYLFRERKFIAAIFPVIINAIMIPGVIILAGSDVKMYWIFFGEILLSQFIVIYLIGFPIFKLSEKRLLSMKRKDLQDDKKENKL